MRSMIVKQAAILFVAAFLSFVPAYGADEYEKVLQQALAMQENGDRKAALGLFRKAVEMDPEEPVGHFLLGRLCFLMQNNEDAVRELRLYVKKMALLQKLDEKGLRAHIANLYDASEIYFTLEKYQEARDAINEILVLDPNDQAAYYNMGVCYYVHERNRSRAYQNFKKVIDLDPNTDMARKASYAIEFIRNNPDPRVVPDFSFLDKE